MTRRGNGHLATPPTHAPRPMAPSPSGSSESLIAIAWRGRWMMLFFVVLAIGGGFAYIQAVTPIYTSTARVRLDYSNLPRFGTAEGSRIPQTERFLSTEADVLASHDILEKALTPELRQLRTFTQIKDPVSYLGWKLRVTVGRREDVIRVSFDSPYAIEAAMIANAVVEAYLADRSERKEDSASRLLDTYTQSVDELKAEVDQKTKELESFASNGTLPTLGLPEQASSAVQTKLQYEAELARLMIEQDGADEFLVRVKQLRSDAAALRLYLVMRDLISLYDTGTGSETTRLQSELTEAQEQHERLLAEFTSDHPQVLAQAAMVERITARLRDVNDRFVQGVLTVAQQRYEEVNQLIAAALERNTVQDEKVASYRTQVVGYQTRIEEIQSLRTRIQTIEGYMGELSNYVTAGDTAGQMKIIRLEDAAVAQEPSSPQKGRVMAIALFLGLLSGGGGTVLRDLLDQKLRSADEISASLGLPILGVVPTMSRRINISARGQHVHVQSDSPEAEAFRTVRTGILFGAPKERARTMLVTSPAQGDGKSTLASNLAIAMAQAGQKTILLDADFRRPVQHTIFEIEPDENGLSAVLAGRQSLAEARHRTQIEGLEVIPAGLKVPNPAEILNSPRFGELLKRLSEHYDRIIVDAPPVTVVTDAQIIGAICGITVLVLRADKSTKKIGERAIDALHRVGANLIGAVVNDVRRNGGRYGYYGSYESYGASEGSGRAGRRPEKAGSGERDKNARLPSAVGAVVRGGGIHDRDT